MVSKISGQTWAWYGLAFLVIVLDQISKHWAQAALTYNEPVVFTSFFNFTLLYNEGAAFSFLSNAGGWQRWFFTSIAIVVSGMLVVWIARVAHRKREAFALAMILGGAIGNVYDRITLGKVVDFIVVHYEQYYWPAFNLADSAITLGAIVLIADMFLSKGDSKNA